MQALKVKINGSYLTFKIVLFDLSTFCNPGHFGASEDAKPATFCADPVG